MSPAMRDFFSSILDLQGKAEVGANFDSVPYVRRRGIGKYSNALKTLLPVRAKRFDLSSTDQPV